MNRGRPKILEDTMKTVMLTPNSSVKSTTTMESNLSETRDSFYFPGCRKDANCNCEICIASINATLDLMPQSIHRSSLAKFSTSRRAIPRSPVSFGSSGDLSTPKSKAQIRSESMSPPLDSTARMDFPEKMKRRKKGMGCGVFVARFILGFILVFGVAYGVSSIVSEFLKVKLSPDLVKNLGERSRDFEGLNGRFMFLRNELRKLVGDKVSSCSSPDSVWTISQDGLLLNSRCVLYESMAEQVSIWGWPLQTAGLLAADYSSRRFCIISGRVTEWSTEEAKYLVRANNSSWAQRKWRSSVVQFDPNTWILEYRKSFLMDNARLFSAIMEFLKFRLTRELEKIKQQVWLPSDFGRQYSDITSPLPT